ncbi:MAG: glycosyltransferase family 4 protein [Verrucomicrobia bacterium]|nr:glycosyltransferase family 4 protein [Verrucomicrobiota bacterium]MBI3870631.1 glycosyltransferase family 4 protein [Verrucomicrobiota bacterium]
MNVVLIGNYAADQQESMLRFGELMRQELSARGLRVQWLQPPARLARRPTGSPFLNKWLAYVDKLALFPSQRTFRSLRAAGSGTLVHVCDHSNAVYLGRLRGVKTVVTCHDLLAVRSARGEFPENPTSRTGRRLQEMILKGIGRADRVVCVSEQTRQDVLRLTSLKQGQVRLVSNGLNHAYSPMESSAARARAADLLRRRRIEDAFFLPGGPGCLLHVGGNSWYKNRPTVIRMYERLVALMADAPALVMVGRPLPPFWRSWIEARGLGKRVHVIDQVSNEDLRALYSTARALVFPSLAEGFGWPIIEAQACGCPVITTPLSPMRDVGGDAAFYCNPHNSSEGAMVIRDLLARPCLEARAARERSLANATRFTTPKMIEGYLEVYHDLLRSN